MNCFNVLIDSNIFIAAKYNFTGGSLFNLKKYCENGTAVLYTNDIIIREVHSHIDDDVGLIARQAKNAIYQNKELVNAITKEAYESIESTLSDATKNLRFNFDSYMDNAIVLSNNNFSIDDLFDMYFNRCSPFENNEKKKYEFPDAAIIMSIKHHLLKNPSMVLHVVTDDKGWHNALEEIPSIALYHNLRELLAKMAKSEEVLYAQIYKYMASCIDELRSVFENWVYEQDWSQVVTNIDYSLESDEIVDVYIIEINMTPDTIEYIDREDKFASALFSGVLSFYMGFNYIDHSNEIYDREDRTYYNTIYGKGAAELKVKFVGSTTILMNDNEELELNSSTFDDVDIQNIEIIDYKLTPHRSDDNSYFAECPDCGRPIGIHNDGGNGFCKTCSSRH